MKITVLIENTSPRSDLCAEHGLSLWIEYGDVVCLLDSGSTGAFAQNADALGLDLRRVQFAMLSHGHYDHAGGFAAFFARNANAPVYALRSAQEGYFSGSGGTIHDIGIPAAVLPAFSGRFCWLDGAYSPAPGVTLLPHTTPALGEIGAAKKLYHKEKGVLQPDDFAHELTAVFETPRGLVVLNSCSHSGLPAIFAEVQAAFPGRPLAAFLGGLHMKGRKSRQDICTFTAPALDALADVVRQSGVEALYTGHCTGSAAYSLLAQRLGSALHPLFTGCVVEV